MSSGEVKFAGTPGRITYFDGFTRVPETRQSNITTAQNLNRANTQFAIQDPQGNIVMKNAASGTIGNMGQYRPGSVPSGCQLDQTGSTPRDQEFELRLDAVNILNHPLSGNPNVDINRVNFGVIGLPTTGKRTFTYGARLNF